MDLHALQQKFVDCIERLNGGAVARMNWQQIFDVLDELTEGLPLVGQQFMPSDKAGRGRILGSADRFDTIDTLSYPPPDKCGSYGRCNRPGAPVFYAGIGTELILSEIGASIGDHVGLLHVSPVKELRCVRLGALDLWRRTSGLFPMADSLRQYITDVHKKPENIVAFLLDGFVRDHFSRPGSHSAYKITSAYTEVVTRFHPDIAGLIYDSVDHTAGACMALKPDVADTLLRPTEVQIVRITSYLGYGVFDFEQVAFADKFDGRKILWQ